MSRDGEAEIRPPDPDPELSLHGLTISPDRPRAPAEPLPPPGGGFTFLREIGRGGMGVVYEAREEATGRHVAVKIIAQRLSGSSDAAERFQREARLAASIAHPNCVFVYGAHVIDGAAAISMELMTGRTLEDRIRSGEPLPVETAVRWAMEILDGLAAANAAGVVHRDVKPSNCFLTADGHVKVGDFGLSRSLEGDLGLTQSGAFLGSPLYASPEQVRGRVVDQRTDVYSAGATLYSLLTGRPPHSGSTFGDVLAQIVADAPPPLATLRPGLPGRLDDVVAKALAKDPAKRFKDCAAFRNALLPYAPGNLTPATLGLRIVAYVVDSMMVSFFFQGVCIAMYFAGYRFAGATREVPWMPTTGLWAWAVPSLLTLAWFSVFESALGFTPGKRLFNLRVVSLDGSRAPWWRTLIRIAVFSAPFIVPTAILGLETRPLHNLARMTVLFIPMLTMRKSNAWRGVHEFASGTRTLRAAAPAESAAAIEALDPVRLADAPAPGRIGPYAVEGLVGPTTRGEIVSARDTALGRSVWIHLGGNVVSNPPDASRPAPLRWLRHGDQPVSHDVYESPGGAGLLEYAEAGKTLPWLAARAHVWALANELAARSGPVVPAQIWIDRTGRLRVLDFPVGAAGRELVTPVEALRRTAAILIGPASDPRPPADLPIAAEPAVRRLLGLDPGFATLEEARAALAGPLRLPVVVSRLRRSLQFGIAAAWFAYVSFMVYAGFEAVERDLVKRGEPAGVPMAKAGVVVAVCLMLYLIPGLILAFALRGGLTFTMLGVRVRRSTGRRAGRLRCLWRAVIANLPALPLLAGGAIVVAGGPFVILPCGLAATLVGYAAGAAWSLATPARGLADRMAGTRLVRK